MLIALKVGTCYSYRKKVLEKLRVDIRPKRRKEEEYRTNDASTAVSQPLTQVSNAAATIGLTSGFGMGPGRSLSLWPAKRSQAEG
jgi:hypothetical protein